MSKQQIIISPSILASDFLNLESELTHFEQAQNLWIHLDVMDGHFVPNLSFGKPVIEKLTKKFPHIFFDAHLMVSNPEFYLTDYEQIGLKNITFHLEACADPQEIILAAKKKFPSVGLSIKPQTPVDELEPKVLELLDLVLVMSVEPGFGGQAFMPQAYEKIQSLKEIKEQKSYHYQIQVDGGVDSSNASKLIASGANNLVAGSFIFKAQESQYMDKVLELRQ